MMQEEIQDSDSSSDASAELVIKPPQTSASLSSVFSQKNKKKRRYLEEHKSIKKQSCGGCQRCRECHVKAFYGNSSNRNQNYREIKRHRGIQSKQPKIHTAIKKQRCGDCQSCRDCHVKPFYANSSNRNQNYREIKRHRGIESEQPDINFMKQNVIDSKYKKLMKDVYQSGRKRNEYKEITNVRWTKPVKDMRESRRNSYRSEDRNTYYLEEMKIEWRHKRLQWLQHQSKQDDPLWMEKEFDLQDKNNEREFNEQHKNVHPEYSRSKMNSPDCCQHGDEINYSIFSPVSSEEENIDNRESEKSKELLDDEPEHESDHEGTITLSDASNDDDDNDAASKSGEESVESTSENEKVSPEKDSLYTELSAKSVVTETLNEENLIAKPMERNKITVASPEKCHSLPSTNTQPPKLPVYCPAIQGCRSVDGFEVLNRIEEGTYGVVYRAKDKETKEIVALKRLKMEREKEGFPITSLREINTLLKAQHPNIVTVREIVVGNHMDRIYIVMDYVEHDLKSLMKIMPRPFWIGEVKTLLLQLLCAVAHLHDNWILHRDLKTSNLLLSHQGILKVGDFGLAREYGSPLKSYTPVVVTLWYRAPELLLGTKKYSTPIDMWSVGCIFSELLTKSPLFPGKSESDQLNRIFKELGTPNENIWPGYSELPLVQSINIPHHQYNLLKGRFSHNFTDLGFDLLNRFLTYNPDRRMSAENAKAHEYFTEKPKPIPPNMFPTWPAKSEREHRTRSSPKPPLGGMHY